MANSLVNIIIYIQGHDGACGRAVRRFVANSGRELATDGESIWSKAPIFGGEDFAVTHKCNTKHKDSGKRSRDYATTASQRSGSQSSNLSEKGSFLCIETTTLASRIILKTHLLLVAVSARQKSSTLISETQVDEKVVKVKNIEGEEEGEEETGNVQSTTADPLSTTSMDDTLSALRKSSFAGRHRGHHRMTVSKLSAAERSRLISAEARRREAAKAEERERKRRHRLAQNKRTLYERIRGINNQRKPTRFRHGKIYVFVPILANQCMAHFKIYQTTLGLTFHCV